MKFIVVFNGHTFLRFIFFFILVVVLSFMLLPFKH